MSKEHAEYTIPCYVSDSQSHIVFEVYTVQPKAEYSILILHLCINIPDRNPKYAGHITSLHLFLGKN